MSGYGIIHLFIFIFGSMIGSFLNVLIHRLPKKEDFVIKRSHCPKCKKMIYWYENIPVLSYIFLRGKCSGCGEKISLRYPLVEIVTGVAALLLSPDFFTSESILQFVFLFSIFCCFLVHFLVDVKHQILPNVINLYLLFIFLMYSFFFSSLMKSGLGVAVGFGLPFIVSWGFLKFKGKEGLGMGDVKLFGVLGIYLGPYLIIQNIFLSCFLGSLFGVTFILTKKMNRNTRIAFGPFILIVAFFQIFFPDYYYEISKSFF